MRISFRNLRAESRGKRGVLILFLFMFSLGLSLSSPLRSEEPLEVEEIVVTGSRLPEKGQTENQPSPLSKMSKKEIEQSGASSLPEALSLLEGLHLTDTVGFGYDSVRLHLRHGGEFDTGLTLLEGVPLNDPADRSVIWREIPLDAISSVEMQRGGTSSMFGETISGVVQLSLPDSVTEPKTKVNTSLGNFGRNRLFFSTLLGDKEKATYFYAGEERIGGYRSESRYNGENYFLSSSYPLLENTRLKLIGIFYKEEHGSPGSLSLDDFENNPTQPGTFFVHFTNSSSHVSARVEREIGEHGTLQFLPFFRQRKTNSLDNFGNDGATESQRRGFVFQFSNSASHLSYLLGGELERSLYESGATNRPSDRVDKSNFALFGKLSWKFSSALSAALEFRHDQANERLTIYECGFDPATFQCTWPLKFQGKKEVRGNSPKVGITYALSPNHLFYLNWSRAFLTPSGFQFTGFDKPYFGNPSISPQIDRGVEAGWRGRLGSTKAALNLFFTKSEREILFNNEIFTNQNVDTKRAGAELSIKRATSHSSFSLAYTLMAAKFDESAQYFGVDVNGKDLPLAPRQRLTFSGAHRWRRLTLALNGTLVSRFYPLNDWANGKKSSGYFLLNAHLNYATRFGKLFLNANNLTNKLYSSFPSSNGQTDPAKRADVFRPMPKFHLFGGAEWEF